MADAARTAMNEDTLARQEAAVIEQPLPCCDAGERYGRRANGIKCLGL